MVKSSAADLAEVRVHVDSPRAGGTTQAFTEGKEIHVAPGRFAPETREGFELLAHEAAHTLQQEGKASRLTRAAS